MVALKIAINGKQKHGKNTFANLCMGSFLCLKNDDPFNSTIMAFADPLKKMVLMMYPQAKPECLFGPSELRSETVPNTDFTYRHLLQSLGKSTREMDENIWVNNLLTRVHKLERKNLILVSDLRFRNEFDALKKDGFTLVRVKRNIINTGPGTQDVSETDLDCVSDDQFNYVIENNSDLKDLRVKAESTIISLI